MRCVFPAAVPTFNQLRTQAIVDTFAAVEYSDPRLPIVLAYSRIHATINQLVEQHCAKQTNGRHPHLFKTASSSLHRAGILDRGYYDFIQKLRFLRNEIAHRETHLETLKLEPHAGDIRRMCELAGVDPNDDFRRCVLQLCVAGCLAIELDFDGQPKGFDALRQYVDCAAYGGRFR